MDENEWLKSHQLVCDLLRRWINETGESSEALVEHLASIQVVRRVAKSRKRGPAPADEPDSKESPLTISDIPGPPGATH